MAYNGTVIPTMPLVGFSLQKAVDGRTLSIDFRRRLASIKNALTMKTAPVDRYCTFDVVHATCETGRHEETALYTGNDGCTAFYREISLTSSALTSRPRSLDR